MAAHKPERDARYLHRRDMDQKPLTNKNRQAITFLAIGILCIVAPVLLFMVFNKMSWFIFAYFLMLLTLPVGILNLVAGIRFNHQRKKGVIRIERGWTTLNILIGLFDLLLGCAAWLLESHIIYIPQ
jgi:hypothetical protein